MANPIKWDAYGTFTTIIAGADVAPTLKGLSSGGFKIGSAIDNSSSLNMLADFDLQVRFASAPAAGGFVLLYLVPAVDGTNYADGSDSIEPSSALLVGAFPVRATGDQQRVVLRAVLLPPGLFKPLIKNGGSTAFTSTDNENVLSIRTYNEEIT